MVLVFHRDKDISLTVEALVRAAVTLSYIACRPTICSSINCLIAINQLITDLPVQVIGSNYRGRGDSGALSGRTDAASGLRQLLPRYNTPSPDSVRSVKYEELVRKNVYNSMASVRVRSVSLHKSVTFYDLSVSPRLTAGIRQEIESGMGGSDMRDVTKLITKLVI